MVPFKELRAVEQLDTAIARERGFLESVGRWVVPSEREAHQRYLANLEHARAGSGGSAIERLRSREQEMIDELRGELAELGDTTGCREDDTVRSLMERRNWLLAQRASEREKTESARVHMGLDGHTGSRDDVGRYEAQQWLAAANPGSGAGVAFAALAAARGGTLDDVRAAGAAGNVVEGLAGGVGHALNQGRAPADDTRVRGTRGDSGPPPRARAQQGGGATQAAAHEAVKPKAASVAIEEMHIFRGEVKYSPKGVPRAVVSLARTARLESGRPDRTGHEDGHGSEWVVQGSGRRTRSSDGRVGAEGA